jgi:hypothetical protein
MSDILSCQESVEQASFLWLFFWVVLALIGLIFILVNLIAFYWQSFFDRAVSTAFNQVDVSKDGTITQNELYLSVMNLSFMMPVYICALLGPL